MIHFKPKRQHKTETLYKSQKKITIRRLDKLDTISQILTRLLALTTSEFLVISKYESLIFFNLFLFYFFIGHDIFFLNEYSSKQLAYDIIIFNLREC